MQTVAKPKRPKKVDVPIDQSMPPPINAATAPSPAAAKAAARTVDDPELLDLLQDAYETLTPDSDGFVGLSALGQRAANRSSFDVRNYGFKRLSDLVDAISAMDVKRRDNHVLVRFKDKD